MNMVYRKILLALASTIIAGCALAADSGKFDPAEIRAATSRLISALENPDPTTWVSRHSEDTVLLEAGIASLYGTSTWANGRPPKVGSTSKVHLVLVWRKESDGQWRVAQEVLVPAK